MMKMIMMMMMITVIENLVIFDQWIILLYQNLVLIGISIDAYAIESIRFVGRKSIEYRSWIYVFHRISPF